MTRNKKQQPTNLRSMQWKHSEESVEEHDESSEF